MAVFSTLAGLLYGAWVDGESLLTVAAYLVGSLALLAVPVLLLRRKTMSRLNDSL